MLTYMTINIFDSPAFALVNAVNTMGIMGKGIAAEFKALYPDMYNEYGGRLGNLPYGERRIVGRLSQAAAAARHGEYGG